MSVINAFLPTCYSDLLRQRIRFFVTNWVFVRNGIVTKDGLTDLKKESTSHFPLSINWCHVILSPISLCL